MTTPGERGKQGDHGQAGDQGIMGLPGERGYQGLTGPTGHGGERGVAGDEGPVGRTGRTGPTGPPLFTRRQILALLMAIVVCFSLLAYRAERNTSDIDGLVYSQCIDRRSDVLKTNALYEGLIGVEEKSASAAQDPRASAERIALYDANKLAVPVCGSKP